MPDYPILEPKLHPPRLPQRYVERPHLYARLDEWGSYKCTLLCASAGAGKTTLVRSWLNRCSLASQVAWLSLDDGDNDPQRFWQYVVYACQQWLPDAQRFLHSPLIPGSSLHTLSLRVEIEQQLSALLNEALCWPEHRLLILEDYHVISQQRVHEMLGFLLAHLPETFHILIITRSQPPIALERYRANGELNELQSSDLCFSYDETATFLAQEGASSLSPELLARLQQQVNGWAAGLRLFLFSLRGEMAEEQIEASLSSFRGSQRALREYFVNEVFATQPEDVQEFLLYTVVLTRLHPSLCDAVLKKCDSAQLLERLERSNLFLEALDGEWYRYQSLFAEALRHEAQRRLSASSIHEILITAATWFEQNNLLTEAIDLLLDGEEHSKAAQLIERYILQLRLLDMREHRMLGSWLERLPLPLLKQYPLLCLSFAAGLAFGREHDEGPQEPLPRQVEEFLRLAEEGWQRQHDQVGLGRVLAFRAFFGFQQEKQAQSIVWAQQALDWLPEDEGVWRGLSLLVLGLHALQTGQLNSAYALFEEIRQAWGAAGYLEILDGMRLILGMICVQQGALQQAAHHYRVMIASDKQGNSPARAVAYMAMAYISYEWNMLDAAQEQVEQAVELSAVFTEVPYKLLMLLIELIQALLLHSQGKTALAVERLIALLTQGNQEQLSTNGLYLYLYQEILSWLVRYALLLGDHMTAQQWLDRLIARYPLPLAGPRLLSPPAEAQAVATQFEEQIEEYTPAFKRNAIHPMMLQEARELLLARLYLARGEAEAVLTLLQKRLPEVQQAGRALTSLEIKLLLAQAYAARKQATEARDMLLQALEQGYANGFQRIFLDGGDQLFILLRDLLPTLTGHPLHSYLLTLLRAFAQEPRQTHITAVSPSIIEPLSKQELRVLRLLVVGRSNQEIASELVVSVNTIRTHVQSIYRKLLVNNRSEASEVARQLHLL